MVQLSFASREYLAQVHEHTQLVDLSVQMDTVSDDTAARESSLACPVEDELPATDLVSPAGREPKPSAAKSQQLTSPCFQV